MPRCDASANGAFIEVKEPPKVQKVLVSNSLSLICHFAVVGHSVWLVMLVRESTALMPRH